MARRIPVTEAAERLLESRPVRWTLLPWKLAWRAKRAFLGGRAEKAAPAATQAFPLERLVGTPELLLHLCAFVDACSIARLRRVSPSVLPALQDGPSVTAYVVQTRAWADLEEQRRTGDLPWEAGEGEAHSWTLERLHLVEHPPRFAPVQFAFNSCRLEAADRSLDGVVKLLRRHGTLRLRVTGHTQPDAPRFIQASLSLQRAEAVVKYLTTKIGAAADGRIDAVGAGGQAPLNRNWEETRNEELALERRVEFSVVSV